MDVLVASAGPSAMGAGSASAASCFHCGLPASDTEAVGRMEVLGESRQFCCPGCYHVCRTIVEAGLADYYRYRADAAGRTTNAAIPDLLQQLEIYDRAEIQKGFVHCGGTWKEASLLLEDIRCPACLWLNERHLRRREGVLDVHIDGSTQRMRVRWDPQATRLSEILAAIAAIGYVAHPYDASHSEKLLAVRRRRSVERLLFAAVVGMMVMHFSIGSYVMGQPDAQGKLPLWVQVGRYTSLLATAALLVYPAQDFWAGAWRDLQNRRLGMDVPIALGLAMAFLSSGYATFTGRGDVYFDSIAMFVALVLLARHWETRGRTQAAERLDRLARATPRTARSRGGGDRAWRQTPVIDLAAGDAVRVLPGETVPVDGVIAEGTSSFDEAVITGEFQPVVHAPGEAVLAGSVNREQPITIEVTQTAEGTTLEQIRRLVDHGLEQRPRVALLADRAARWFVTAVLLIALGTATVWIYVDPALWLRNTIAVLIVTCPCALALAAPVALAVSAGRLIEIGVLPLRMSALDALARVDTVALDKTGTLTVGQPSLVEVTATGDYSAEECLERAAALACWSEHPIARALRAERPTPVHQAEMVDNTPGGGLLGRLQRIEWRLGNVSYVCPGPLGPHIQRVVDRYRKDGHSVSLLSSSAGIQAVMAFSDTLRSGAENLVVSLKKLGIAQVAIVSGDGEASVRGLGMRIGADEIRADMSPRDKLRWLTECQRRGRRVLMLGDGLNDAATLAHADASASLSEATDLANASSDIVLLNNRLDALPAAIVLARETRHNIRRSLLWAFAYNALAVPAAAFGLVPPWLAAIGMSASSLLVVFNALRLRRAGAPADTGREAAMTMVGSR